MQSKWLMVLSGALVATLAVGCGSVANNPPDGGGVADSGGQQDFSLTVDPTSLSVPIASSGTATVTIARSPGVGDITFSAQGLPSGVTATFSPNPVPVGGTTTELTLDVAPGTAAGSAQLTIAGSAGGLERTATLAFSATTITVSGTVRGNRSGVTVGLVGKGEITSGAGGVFTFSDVTPPYDLYTIANGGPESTPVPTVMYFDDLTRPDPIVSAAATYPTSTLIKCGLIIPCPSATVNGTKSGSGNTTDPVVIAWSNGGFTDAPLGAGGTYTLTAYGFTNDVSNGQLHAIQFTRKASGAPDTFLGYGKSAQMSLNNGGTYNGVNVALAPVGSTATITGTITAPPGYPAPTLRLRQEFGNTSALLWNTTATATADATFPLIAGAGTNFYASATLDGGWTEWVYPLTASADVSFTMPAAPVIATPADVATGVTSNTEFTWTSAANTVNELEIGTNGTSDPRLAYRIFTTASSVKIPVLPGVTVPANRQFYWRVRGYGPNAHVNEAAASNELEAANSVDYAGPPHANTYSPSRTFTTAP